MLAVITEQNAGLVGALAGLGLVILAISVWWDRYM
jgi:hypothetical protein